MIKNDVATEKFMSDLFAKYAVQDVNQFRYTCSEVVSQLAGNEGKKIGFIQDLKNVRSKDRMITKVTNFILAGQGLKVV